VISNPCITYIFIFMIKRILYFQAKDRHGISALLAAIWEGHTDCVKLLLEKVSQHTLF
jgi:ankyrin repeat protein